MRTETDLVFRLAGTQDPFASGNPYLMALLDMPPRERKAIVRQVVLLCAAVEGLDPLGALELLAAVSPFVGGDRP
ncbi:MAG: hypothetical protein WHV44_11355 [Anaerolineales bacterium]